MALNIKPLSDRVLIEPVAAETQTASGIFIPDTAKEKPQKGTVVAVGNGNKRRRNDSKSWRYCSLWKICRNRIKIRRKRLFDHARR